MFHRKKKRAVSPETAAPVSRAVLSPDSTIEFSDVWFTYDELPAPADGSPAAEPDDSCFAVKDVTLSIRLGECVAVLGHNGSGKSTLAKLCNGILAPDRGTVTCFGIDTADEENLLELRQHVGMVFQNPDNQIVASVVEEDVAFGPENLGVPPEEIQERVDRALKTVGMYDYRLHAPNKLSGGQKQRVAIAGVLAMEPECILFDESTAMLDPRGRKEVMETLHKLHDELGKTVVFITHYMEEAVTADRVIVMDDGRVLKDGTPQEVFADIAGLRAVGLDVPQATELGAVLRDDGWDLPADILSTSDCVEALARSLSEV